MKKEIKEKLPNWYKNLDGMGSIMTADLDSLLGHYFIGKKFNINCSAFFDFNSISFSEDKRGKMFGIDLDIVSNGKTFGNHITHFYKNESAINLNNYVGNIKYYQKYPLSTVLLILSLYNFDMESMTDEQLKIIYCIDASYGGWYTDVEMFRNSYNNWLNRLGIRFLEDRLLKNMTKSDWNNIRKKYNLNSGIYVDEDGYLKTNIKLDEISKVFNDKIELPKEKFHLHKSYEYLTINPSKQAIPPRDKIISMAWTRKNQLKLTIK